MTDQCDGTSTIGNCLAVEYELRSECNVLCALELAFWKCHSGEIRRGGVWDNVPLNHFTRYRYGLPVCWAVLIGSLLSSVGWPAVDHWVIKLSMSERRCHPQDVWPWTAVVSCCRCRSFGMLLSAAPSGHKPPGRRCHLVTPFAAATPTFV